MKTFETVYNELENLLIKKLPDYIEKINKEHNDNLIIKPFENTSLEENCIKQPCFKLTFKRGEYSEKDRIIESEIYITKFEMKFPENQKNKIPTFWRYVEALAQMIAEEETVYDYETTDWYETTVEIHICNRN